MDWNLRNIVYIRGSTGLIDKIEILDVEPKSFNRVIYKDIIKNKKYYEKKEDSRNDFYPVTMWDENIFPPYSPISQIYFKILNIFADIFIKFLHNFRCN